MSHSQLPGEFAVCMEALIFIATFRLPFEQATMPKVVAITKAKGVDAGLDAGRLSASRARLDQGQGRVRRQKSSSLRRTQNSQLDPHFLRKVLLCVCSLPQIKACRCLLRIHEVNFPYQKSVLLLSHSPAGVPSSNGGFKCGGD